MESIIQMLAPLIIVILISLLSNSRRRKAQQRNAERERDENTMAEREATPPPFMEDFPFETQLEQMIAQQDEEEVMQAVEEPAQPEPQKSLATGTPRVVPGEPVPVIVFAGTG